MNINKITLNKLLEYNRDTGILTWKERSIDLFSSYQGYRMWNARFSGKIAGNKTKWKEGTKHYINIGINHKLYKAHRIAWIMVNGDIPEDKEIDHINGNGADNRIENLRLVNRTDNARNHKRRKDNTSGVSGVSWCSTHNKWIARIGVGGKRIKVGSYNNIEEAVEARKKAEISFGYHENHGTDRPLY